MKSIVFGVFILNVLSVHICAASPAVPNEPQAVYYDAADVHDTVDVHWEQRCLLETLQGIVNRQGPRLFLNSPAWDMPWDNQWVDIYAQRNGLKFQKDIFDIPSLIQHFKNDVNGFIVYDSKVDGSRYTAMTLAAIENLLPISPGLLDGYLGSLDGFWTGVDFTKINVYQLLSAWGEGLPQSSWQKDFQLAEGIGVVGKSMMLAGRKPVDSATLEYGPFFLNLSSQPFMEVAVGDLEGGTWQVQLLLEDKTVTFDGGTEKVKRWNIAAETKLRGKMIVRAIRLTVSGKGAQVTWKSVRFADDKGNLIPLKSPRSLTEQTSLEIKHDLRGKFKDTLSAYQWGLENLMPRCDNGFAHTVDGVVDGRIIGSGPWRSCDFAVMKKGFIFNLSFNEKDTAAFGYTYKGEPNQARMYRTILSSLKQPAFITGYGDCENDWFPLMNEYGHAYLVPQYCNTSFHSAVKPIKKMLKQKKHYTVNDVNVDPNKYYVCFISSDGDTLKGPISQHYQSWNMDKKRGSIPFTFAMPMSMGRYFPAMLEYYYDTATENDYFTGCAVWKLNSSDKAALGLYARLAEDMKLSDYDTINNVSIEPVEPNKYELFNNILHPLGVSQVVWWKSSVFGAVDYTADGTPVITNPEWLGYCQRATDEGKWEATPLDVAYKDKEVWRQTVKKLVDYCELSASKHKPPFVIIIFPSLHHHFTQYSICSDIAQALNKDKFKVVRFDEAAAIMKKYHQETTK